MTLVRALGGRHTHWWLMGYIQTACGLPRQQRVKTRGFSPVFEGDAGMVTCAVCRKVYQQQEPADKKYLA